MNIYQVTAISLKDVDGYDRKDIAHLITTPHDLFATLMGAVDSVMDAANEERRAQYEDLNESSAGALLMAGYRPVGLIEWDISMHGRDGPVSPTYHWTDPVTGIAYFIYECEVGK